MTEYPGEEIPPSVDPDVEPQPEQDPAAEPDYETEPEPDGDSHPLIDETMARLDDLRDRPVSEHAEVYADVHERLQAALVEADAEHGDRV